AHGPTNNCIGIGDVLRRRGHRVVFAAEASWKGRLSALGFAEELVDLAPPAGQWHAGVRLDRLRGALAYEYVQHGDEEDAHPYDRDVYERVTTSTTAELADHPAAVTERLVAPLLRGLAI